VFVIVAALFVDDCELDREAENTREHAAEK
jgi:hypothetical protein